MILLHGCMPCALEMQLFTMAMFALPLVMAFGRKVWSKVRGK